MRTLLFVRHGQYHETSTGMLTALGREQARRTGRALTRDAPQLIWTSTLPRALETAAILAEALPGVAVRRTPLLREVVPTRLPARHSLGLSPADIRADRERADRAFERLVRPSSRPRVEAVVCHGNLIRYLVCRAMRVRAGAWTRLDSLHCGITAMRVLSSGAVRVTSYNDTRHLPPRLRTMSMVVRVRAAGVR